MLFTEEMNSYYGGPTFQPTPVAAVTTGGAGAPPISLEAWKGQLVGVGHHLAATMSSTDGHGTTDSSKLMTKWGGHPMDYSKMAQNEVPPMGSGGGPFAQTGVPYGGGGATPWGEQSHQQHNNHHPQHQQQFAQFQAEAAAAMTHAENKFLQMNMKASAPPFQLQGIPQQAPSGPFAPQMDLINGQWGRAEINQCTPWNLEMNGADPGYSGPPPSHPNYRKWDQQRGPPPDDGGQIFGPGGYGTVGAAGGYAGVHVYGGGERMVRRTNRVSGGIPQFVGAGGRGGPSMGNRTWDSTGGSTKFVPDLSVAGPSGGGGASHRKFAQFNGPPPPLNMMPPRHPAMFGHLHPPPLFTSLNPPHATGTQFNTMGTFGMQNGTTTTNIQTAGLSEDAIWQDPNGELRKWQRDTGTSIWGDPAEQTVTIQRWQQFTADEVVAKSNLLAKDGGEVVESGWYSIIGQGMPLGGELPPIGNNTNSGTISANGNNETTTTISGSTAQQFVGGTAPTATAKGPTGAGTAKSNASGAWNGGGGANADGDTQQQKQQPQQPMGTAGWGEQISVSGNLSQPHGNHYHITQQQMPSGNFVLPPPATAPSAVGGQQPPSLLAMIDSNSTEGGDGGAPRKAMSPAQQSGTTTILQATPQQPQGLQQTLKVSLAEELSTLGTHGMGNGFW